jgi:hypothetical protein
MDSTIKGMANSLSDILNLSMSTFKSGFEATAKNLADINKVLLNTGIGTISSLISKKDDHGCCPPEDTCPPHCLREISRCAFAGERIIVPFRIKNICSEAKQYRIGMRDLKNDDGTVAPAIPVLDKNDINLEPGESVTLFMSLDLANFQPGSTYRAEIVVRERDINQNICFCLKIDGHSQIPLVEPLPEKKYLLHWQSWRSHFYCEPQ